MVLCGRFRGEDSDGISGFFVGEVILAEHVDVSPYHGRVLFDRLEQVFACFGVWRIPELAGEIEIVPANNAILDQPVAGLCDFLLFFFYLGELTRITDSDCAGKAICHFDFVELLLDRLAQREITNIAQDDEQ